MSSRRTGVRPVDQGVALASGDEPAIHRIGNSPGDDDYDRQAAPQQWIDEACCHRARDREDDQGVDDLHRHDRQRV